MELDKETLLQDLNNFNKVANETDSIPEHLEKFLVNIAKTGDTWYAWSELKPLIKRKIELIASEFNEKFPYEPVPNSTNVQMFKPFEFNEMCQLIVDSIDSFYGAPFTIQRLCELLTCPYKHYKRTDKFMRALEKNVLVVSTIEPRSESEINEYIQKQKNAAFFSSSSSNYYVESTATHTSYVNGVTEIEADSITSKYTIAEEPGVSNHPAPLQQLDSFTTVFASTPSTPLDVVSDIQNYDNKSSPLSSESSDSNSPQSAGSPLSNERTEINGDVTLEVLSEKVTLDSIPVESSPTETTPNVTISIESIAIESNLVSLSEDIESVVNEKEEQPNVEPIVSDALSQIESLDKVESVSNESTLQIKSEEATTELPNLVDSVSENQMDESVQVDTPRKRGRAESPTNEQETIEEVPEKISKLEDNSVSPDLPENKKDEQAEVVPEETNLSDKQTDEQILAEEKVATVLEPETVEQTDIPVKSDIDCNSAISSESESTESSDSTQSEQKLSTDSSDKSEITEESEETTTDC